MTAKPKVATVWLDGCSGCHMSFLDIDERLVELAGLVDIVYGPLADTKIFPEVDVTLVEGAVSSEEDLHKLMTLRARSKIVVALGDCAVTSNVPSMRNPVGVDAVMARAYLENVTLQPQLPNQVIPKLLKNAVPIHEVVQVDAFIPGCPPSADTIFAAIMMILEGKEVELTALTRFGA